MVKKVDRDVGKRIKKIKRINIKSFSDKKVKKKLGSKAIRFNKKNKVVVSKLPPHLKKRGFVGFRQTGGKFNGKTRTVIFLDEDLKGKEFKRTYWHEAGHHKAKRFLKPSVRKSMTKELKGKPIFNKVKRQGYTNKQVPEEILVELFATHQVDRKRTVPKSFPVFRKQFNNLIKM